MADATLYRFLRKRGVHAPTMNWVRDRHEEWRTLAKQGASQYSIAKQYGVTQGAVSLALSDYRSA